MRAAHLQTVEGDAGKSTSHCPLRMPRVLILCRRNPLRCWNAGFRMRLEDGADAIAVLLAAFRKHGVPQQLLSANDAG
jgi:hypothetical protein